MSKENKYIAFVGCLIGLVVVPIFFLLRTVREYNATNALFYILIGIPFIVGIISIFSITRHFWQSTEYKPNVETKLFASVFSEFLYDINQQIKSKSYLLLIPLTVLALSLVFYFRDAKFKPYSQGCNGLGVNNATVYKGGAGLHPVIFLSSTGKVNSWTNKFPPNWQPSSTKTIELIACGEEKEILIETCNYDVGPDVQRYRYQTDIRLFEAHNGQKIGEKTFYGSVPRACNQTEDIDIERLDGSHTDFEDVKDWLNGFVVTGESPLVRTIQVGNGSHLFAYDGTYMWVSNSTDNTVQKVDPEMGIAGDPIPAGNNPVAMVYDGKQMWIINQGDNTVQKFDPSTGETSAPIKINITPFFAVLDRNLLWIGDSLEYKLQTIDINTDKAGTPITLDESPKDLIFSETQTWVVTRWSIKSVDVGTGKTSDLVTFDKEIADTVFEGKEIWISFRDDNLLPANYLQVIDSTTGVETTLRLQTGAGIRDLILTDNQLWLAESKNGTLQSVDIYTSKIYSTIQVGQTPKALVVDKGQLYILSEEEYKPSTTETFTSSFISKLDLATGQVSIPIQVGVQVGPGRMIFDGTRIWIDNYNTNTVQFVAFP